MIRELDADCKDKKDKADKEEQKECLLQSLHTQLSTYLCLGKDEKIYNYEDPMARKLMQDSLQLRFSLVGGMFDSICKSQGGNSIASNLFGPFFGPYLVLFSVPFLKSLLVKGV